jgi:cell wall-associated NlpC family hydrolase
MRSKTIGRTIFALAVSAIAAAALAAPAGATTGGATPPGETAPTTTTTPTTTTGPPGRAKLLPDGTALAPSNAPPAVVNAIAAANTIHTMPYVWGGGHRSFTSRGYDCSGAVSFMLHGAGLLTSPLPSGPLMRWGAPGPGAWISVFANAGHTYAVVAGLRWDTSAVGEKLNAGSGPRWRATKRSARGYSVRHYLGY